MSTITTLLKGTFILTLANTLTRLMGFSYRIFLSRVFTAEEIGLYQLVFPVYTLGLSLCVAGIQTSLSRLTARYVTQNRPERAILSLKLSLLTVISLSFLFIFAVQQNLTLISTVFLKKAPSGDLLLFLLYALPFASIHSIICGYYMGLRQTRVVALSQLFEQLGRLSFVFLTFYVLFKKSATFPISFAVIGIVVGELAACMYTLFKCRHVLFSPRKDVKKETFFSVSSNLFSQVLPLTANRVCVNFMQSIESVSIPVNLELYGLSSSDALGTYGIFTGMALPCILFPSALTNALSAMLLPTIASIQISHKNSELWSYIKKISFSCFLMGTTCFLAFYFSGKWIGNHLFQSEIAGYYISSLSFICPFLYMNTTLLTTLNALGNTFSSFFINICSLLLRIGSVYFLIPLYGPEGYMFGLFTSQIMVSCISLFRIHYLLSNSNI